MSSPDSPQPAGRTQRLPLALVLENLRSLHNVGAIFRSADGAGVSRVCLVGLTPRPPRHEIAKTALGATETVPWQYFRDIGSCLAALRADGYRICALEQTPQAQDMYAGSLAFPLALVAGHEREGVTPEALALCDCHLQLPMHGGSARSLNVAAAVGIALYECLRRLCYDGTS